MSTGQKTQCSVLGRSFVLCAKNRNVSYCAETSFTERETQSFATRQKFYPLDGQHNNLIVGRNYVNWGKYNVFLLGGKYNVLLLGRYLVHLAENIMFHIPARSAGKCFRIFVQFARRKASETIFIRRNTAIFFGFSLINFQKKMIE